MISERSAGNGNVEGVRMVVWISLFLALCVASFPAFAQRHVRPIDNADFAADAVGSQSQVSTATGSVCGFEETTANGPWVLATSTGLITWNICATCHGSTPPDGECFWGYSPGYSNSVPSTGVLNNCDGHIRFWKYTQGATAAIAAPLVALDNRPLQSFVLGSV